MPEDFDPSRAVPAADPDFDPSRAVVADPPSGIIRRTIGDAATGLAQGSVALPQAALALANLVTGGAAEKVGTLMRAGADHVVNTIGDALTGSNVERDFGATGDTATQGLDDTTKQIGTYYSPEVQRGQQAVDEATTQGGKDAQATFGDGAIAKMAGETYGAVKGMVQNPSTILPVIAQSAPSFLAPSAIVGRVAAGVGSRAAARAITAGASQEAAQAAAQAAVGKFVESAPGIATSALSEGLMGGGQNASQAKAEVLDMPQDKLAALQSYKDLVAQGMSPQEARLQLADVVEAHAMVAATALSSAAGPIAGRLEARTGAKLFAGDAGKGVQAVNGAANLGRNIAAQSIQEAVQSGGEQVGQNIGSRAIDPNVDLADGVGAQIGGGIIGGAFFGAGEHFIGAHGGHPAVNSDGTVNTASGVPIDPNAGPISAAAASAALQGLDAPLPYHDDASAKLAVELANIQAVHDANEAIKRQSPENRSDENTLHYSEEDAKAALAAAKEEAARPKAAPSPMEKAAYTSTFDPELAEKMAGVPPRPTPPPRAMPVPPTPTEPPRPTTEGTPNEASTRSDEQAADGGSEEARAPGQAGPDEGSGPGGGSADASTEAGSQRVNDEAGLHANGQRSDGRDGADAGQVGTVDEAAHEAAASPTNDKPEPTGPQIEAGNYEKGHLRLHGLDISVENPHGSTRSSKPGDVPAWSRVMNDHYGYIRGTVGNDKDHIDAFVKRGTPLAHNGPIFVIDQPNSKGSFDEHKVMIGYRSRLEAVQAYKSNYPEGHKVGRVTETTAEQFRAWAKEGDTTKPFAEGTTPSEPPGPVKPSEPPGPVEDRRADAATRKRVNEMTDAEKAKALLTDDLTGLGNRRALDEAGDAPTHTSIDVDSLKWINDNLGHENGDAVLRAVGAAIANETDRGFHLSGDEFVVQSDSPADAASIMKAVDDTLSRAVITYTAPDGTVTTLNGIGITHGTAESLSEADAILRQAKLDREASGERASRGETPASATVETAEGRQAARDAAAAEEASRETARVEAEKQTAVEAKARADADAARKSLEKAATKAESEKMSAARKQARQNYRDAQAEVHAALAGLDLTNEADLTAAVKRYISEQVKTADSGRKAALEVLHDDPESIDKLVDALTKVQAKQKIAAAKAAKEAEKAAKEAAKTPNKLTNTGIDLRRHWELVKAQMKEKADADGTTTMNSIFAATTRADFFAGLLTPDATPGAQKYVDLIRDKAKPFKEWVTTYGGLSDLRGGWYDAGATKKIEAFVAGDAYTAKTDDWRAILGDEKFNASRYSNDDATLEQRLAYLQAQADAYVDAMSKLIAPLSGAASMADLMEKFGKFAWERREGERNWNKSIDTGPRPAAFYATPAFNAILGTSVIGGSDMYDLRPDSYTTQNLITNEATIEGKAKTKQLVAPRLDAIVRTGLTDERGNRNVTPAEFKDKFGFADVGFGTWVQGVEDQKHLNAAYDSFNDLAVFMGIPANMIGFGGRLHFTLGALGSGKKAAATFHPAHPIAGGGVVQAINLTKTKGDGTVAHEWFHALDHFMERTADNRQSFAELIGGLKRAYDFSHVEARVDEALKGQRGYFTKSGKSRFDVEDTADRIIDYYSRNPKDTTYFQNAKALDGGDAGSNPYWSNNAELSARAFEAFVGDKLGGVNNYLVNTAWSGDGMAQPPSYRGTPYPRLEERAGFHEWYKALAGSLSFDGGLPIVDREKFNALKPFKQAEWNESIRQLRESIPERIEAIQREKAAKQAAEEAAAAEAFRAKSAEAAAKVAAAKAEREAAAAAEAAAAEAQAREDAAANPPPAAPPAPDAALSLSDLEAMFDEAASDVRQQAGTNPETPAPGERALNYETPPAAEIKAATTGDENKADAPAPPPKANALIAAAAKQGVKGIDEALSGLTKLFGGGKIQSFPGGFDEDAYRQAKPHFEASLAAFQQAGRSLKDLFRLLIQQLGEGVKPYAVRFAQDMKLTAALSSTTTDTATSRVANWVKAQLDAGTEFNSMRLFQVANQEFGGTQGEGKYTPKDAYDALELGMNRHILASPEYGEKASYVKAGILMGKLSKTTNLLATQTKRTAEQDEFQQFSTVPALAYAATWVANITPGETMLEPSAGTGGLAVFAKLAGAKIVANELSDRRAAVLREALPDAQVFTENAEHIDDVLPDDVKPSTIIMNPPFSSTAGRLPGSRDTKNGALHIEQALARLADGGRLVAIVGNGMDDARPAFKAWWADLKTKYNVRANLNLNGAEYSKYGTAFDNNLLVIDKTGPTVQALLTGRVESYADLPKLLNDIREARNEPSASDLAPESVEREQRGGDGPVAGGLEVDGRAGGADAGAVGNRGEGNQRGDAGPSSVESGRGKRGDATDEGRSGQDNGARGRRRPRGDESQSGSGRDGGAGGAERTGTSGVAPGDRVTLDKSESAKPARALTDSVFEAYEPEKAKLAGAKPHPGLLVESAAMASVEPVDVTYTPDLPKSVITSGKLSAAQIEPIIYAGQAHQSFLPVPKEGATPVRRGYFIGDGTGVGKGREIAGIILDNMQQGRQKHVWVSAKTGLFDDAKRDFGGIDGDTSKLFRLDKTRPADPVKTKDGVMFTSYDTLKTELPKQLGEGLKKGAAVVTTGNVSGTLDKFDEKKSTVTMVRADGTKVVLPYKQVQSIGGSTGWQDTIRNAAKPRSRIDQIAEWVGENFDGVIAFDEAHNLGNLGGEAGKRGSKEASDKAKAGVALQARFPNARVVYVSATGATEVANLMYAERLGLWGPNTAFATSNDFAAKISAAGLASMELVARDMKAQGSYIARSLSYDGVGYERLEAPLSAMNTEIYNELATAWQGVLKNINAALASTGQAKNTKAKSNALSSFWGTHQRFFNQVITSMQTPAIIERAQQEIANGNAVVFQLTNTNEAVQERQVERAEADGTPLEELDFSPRDALLEYVRNSFPVQKYQTTIDPSTGKEVSTPVKDSQGNPVLDKAAVAARDALLQKLADIRVPNNPIDEIMAALGHENVAEVTGRGRRFVQENDGNGGYKLAEQKRGTNANRADAQAFMDDKKRALIFSDAGGTGYSFQSDRGAQNQRRRIHFLVQPGWRADNAVQGFGRTHRSNEVNQPNYILPTTNLKAQRRFISSIARRLDQLGALTKGQRNTSSGGLFTNRDNLESKYAKAAMRSLIEDMAPSRRATGIGNPVMSRASEFIEAMGLNDIYDEKGNLVESKMPEMTRFLNRLLSLTVDQQDALFGEFENRMDAATDAAVKNGTYDDGMQTVKALTVNKVRDETIYTDPRSGATTRYVELKLTNEARVNDWDTAQEDLEAHPGKAPPAYYRDTKNGRVFAVVNMGSRTKADGSMELRGYRVGVPAGQSVMSRGYYINNLSTIEAPPKVMRSAEDGTAYSAIPYQKLTPEAAKSLWAMELERTPKTVDSDLHMLTGVLLPVWDRIQTGDASSAVVRTQTDEGERLIGRVLPDRTRSEVLKNFGVGAIKADTPTADLIARIQKGETAQLSNGWLVKSVRVSNEPRLEIKASYLSMAEQRALEAQGAIVERINYQERVFIPSGAAQEDAFEALTRGANRPVVDFQGGKEAAPDNDILADVRKVSPLGFYSGLERSVDKLAPFGKNGEVGAGQLRLWLAAKAKDGTVKPAEVAATGLDDYLALQGGKVSKADVQAFLANNGVQVSETMLGDKTLPPLPDGWTIKPGDEGEGGGFVVVNDRGQTESWGETAAEAHDNAIDGDAQSDAGTKFGSYALPGGENYRELLLTLPEDPRVGRFHELDVKQASGRMTLDERMEHAALMDAGFTDSKSGTFRSSHFDQPNILAHVRFNERTDADGKKVLFIEELQSDWAQQGREFGFKDQAAWKAASARFLALQSAMSDVDYSDLEEASRRQRELNAARDATRAHLKAVPSGPFVGKTEAWVSLAMKRMIRYAAENGYDRIAFTTGEQQDARYPADDAQGDKIAHGMTAFYNQIVPNVANDVLRKLGGDRVTTVPVYLRGKGEEGTPAGAWNSMRSTDMQPGFDITPKLRETVMAGIPLFDAGAAPTGTTMDAALRSAATTGSTAAPLLQRIADGSATAFNVVLAKRLMALGIDSRVIASTFDGLKLPAGVDPDRVAAVYRRSDDTVMLGPNASEKNLMHELTHAATVRAIAEPGPLRDSLLDLMSRIRATGMVDESLYGMSNPDEFIAEAFTNPAFQDALRDVPIAGKLRSAWDAFVNLVRRVLGLQPGTALEQAILIGHDLMERNAQIQAGTPQEQTQAFADHYPDIIESARTFATDMASRVKTQPGGESFNFWRRSVGTQYDKAMANAHFKAVYDAGQKFLSDVSQVARRAADSAPTILPKIDSIAGLGSAFQEGLTGKRGADMQKAAEAIFTGTLENAVFSDEDLARRFGLDEKQTRIYREFRQSTDTMLDDLMASDAARMAKGKGVDDAIEAGRQNPHAAPDLIAAALRAVGEDKIANDIESKAARIRDLQAKGYAPLSRFGRFTAYVTGKDGEQHYFGMYDTEAARNKALPGLRETFPDATVTPGVMSKERYKQFLGLNPAALELFAEAMGVSEREAVQEYLRKAVNNRSGLKRLIERKGIAGFSQDVPRVLASFITSSSRLASQNYNTTKMSDALAAIPKENGDVIDEGQKLVSYLTNPTGEEAPLLRGVLFANYIGGSVASALTNLTQPILQTAPYLNQWAGAKTASIMTRAAKIATFGGGDADMLRALAQARADGVIDAQELHQLHAETGQGIGSNLAMQAAMKVWGAPFAAAEGFNRRMTFIAAYEIGRGLSEEALKAAGVNSAFEFAEKAIAETQGVYNRGNRPNWSRGALGATVFTFKQFSVSYIEFVNRLPMKQKVIALALLTLAAGTQGLPFAQDIEDIIDIVGQSMGYDTNAKRSFKQHILNAAVSLGLGEGIGRFISGGLSTIPGMPLDVQGRLGLGNLIPGLPLLKRSEPDKAKATLEIVGPLGQFVNNISDAVTRMQAGDYAGAARSGLPSAIQNLIKGVDIAETGVYRNTKGQTVIKADMGDAITKALGFQPANVALEQAKIGDVAQNIALNRVVEQQIVEQWARGLFEKDAAKVKDATEALRLWNQRNPQSIIRIPPTTIQAAVRNMILPSSIREIKASPKTMRGDAANVLLSK